MEQTEAPSTINPGDEPPEEYFLFLKKGGEVAQLGQQFTAEDLKCESNLTLADRSDSDSAKSHTRDFGTKYPFYPCMHQLS